MLQHPFASHMDASLRLDPDRHGTATAAASCVTSTQRHGIVIAPAVPATEDMPGERYLRVNAPHPLDSARSAAPQQSASDPLEPWPGSRRDGSRDRPAKQPGGQECSECGCIFIGEEWHALCRVCEEARSAAPQQSAPRAVHASICLACLGEPSGAHWLGGCRFCSRRKPAGDVS